MLSLTIAIILVLVLSWACLRVVFWTLVLIIEMIAWLLCKAEDLVTRASSDNAPVLPNPTQKRTAKVAYRFLVLTNGVLNHYPNYYGRCRA